MRTALEEAQRKEKEAQSLKDVADEKLAKAENDLRKFWDAHGLELTETGWKKQRELNTVMEQAQPDFWAACDTLSAAISERLQAENKISRWVNAECVAREAKAAEQAKTAAKPLTLSERLHALAQKLT